MKILEFEKTLDAYFQLNKRLYNQGLGGEVVGSRYIANGITVEISDWGEFPKLEDVGYPSEHKRLARLTRNYFEPISHKQARDLFERRALKTDYIGAPLSYTTNKIKQSGNLGCIVGGSLTWKNQRAHQARLEADYLFRISETVKVLPADLVFLNRCMIEATPVYLYSKLKRVRLHFGGCYVVPGFFPQLVAMMVKTGRLNSEYLFLKDTTFGRACYRALLQARDLKYKSKWKPQIRIHNFYRKVVITPEDKALVFSKVILGREDGTD